MKWLLDSNGEVLQLSSGSGGGSIRGWSSGAGGGSGIVGSILGTNLLVGFPVVLLAVSRAVLRGVTFCTPLQVVDLGAGATRWSNR